jgi:hypothetical protein
MERHGVPNAEVTIARGAAAEPARVTVLGLYGIGVPSGVSRAHFETALSVCGQGFQRYGIVPLPRVLQQRISQVVGCLARNGYAMVTANFSNPGALINTPGVDTTATRWIATLHGCEVTTKRVYSGPPLTEAALKRCVGAQQLAETATATVEFRRRVGELEQCMKHS